MGAPDETRPLKPMVGNLSGGLNPRAHTLGLVNTVYVIAVMTSLNCGVDVLCLRAVEPDSAIYVTLDICLAARDRLVVQNDALRELRLKCVPKSSAMPYAKND
jgi:hypothetical protein